MMSLPDPETEAFDIVMGSIMRGEDDDENEDFGPWDSENDRNGDVLERAQPWLELCWACDAGLLKACTCPTGDYRVIMLELVREVESLRAKKSQGTTTESDRTA
jgi:hypothetical protein